MDMITNICLLLEILSIVICLHQLYGEKFRLDIVTTSFLVIYMIFMTMINYYNLPKIYTMVMYPMVVMYCGAKFGFKIKSILTNMILCIVIVGGIQMLIALVFYFIFKVQFFVNMKLFAMNFFALVMVCLLLPKLKVVKISNFLLKKEKVIKLALVISIMLIIVCFFSYKELAQIELRTAIMLFISIVFMLIFAEQLGLSRAREKEIETELKMHKLYADSFQRLIDNIRSRQHEFDNHISTIYSQHYIYKTHEELVEAQENYCEMITKENRFNKLLASGNPIITGFLYGKFIEIDKKGIDIEYKVNVRELEIEMPIYKIVEILGNLIDNAVEAIQNREDFCQLYISLVESDNVVEMEVRNVSEYIDYDKIETFFLKGYSSKGENRGLGLYNVKKLCNENKMELYCKNIEIDGNNWLSFMVVKKKPF